MENWDNAIEKKICNLALEDIRSTYYPALVYIFVTSLGLPNTCTPQIAFYTPTIFLCLRRDATR